MSISSVSAGQDISATHLNDIAAALNAVNGRQIFTSSGTFTWPAGVNRVKVTLAGGGGRAGASWFAGVGGTVQQPSSRGGNSPMCSKIVSGIDAGTTISITIGAAGVGTAAGGTTSFGSVFQSTGGTGGVTNVVGTDGTHTGEIQHDNRVFVFARDDYHGIIGYGQGYPSNSGIQSPVGYSQAGGPGILVIEW